MHNLSPMFHISAVLTPVENCGVILKSLSADTCVYWRVLFEGEGHVISGGGEVDQVAKGLTWTRKIVQCTVHNASLQMYIKILYNQN